MNRIEPHIIEAVADWLEQRPLTLEDRITIAKKCKCTVAEVDGAIDIVVSKSPDAHR